MLKCLANFCSVNVGNCCSPCLSFVCHSNIPNQTEFERAWQDHEQKRYKQAATKALVLWTREKNHQHLQAFHGDKALIHDLVFQQLHLLNLVGDVLGYADVIYCPIIQTVSNNPIHDEIVEAYANTLKGRVDQSCCLSHFCCIACVLPSKAQVAHSLDTMVQARGVECKICTPHPVRFFHDRQITEASSSQQSQSCSASSSTSFSTSFKESTSLLTSASMSDLSSASHSGYGSISAPPRNTMNA